MEKSKEIDVGEKCDRLLAFLKVMQATNYKYTVKEYLAAIGGKG